MTANRTKIVRVRLTPEEYESLEKKVQNSDFKDISKCMRALIAAYVKGYSGLDQLQDIAESLRQIAANGIRVGSNLNQLAKWYNETGGVIPADLRGTHEDLSSFNTILMEQLRRLEREIRKRI